MSNYCFSRFATKRNPTRVVRIGNVLCGGNEPIRIQSMTNTPTEDVDATVKQTIALVEAGCEIVRITAPNIAAAKALKDIRQKLNDAKIHVPLVADIHFLPKAAMEAIEHVEKVRINPGNYADKKKFAILEYTDAQYEEELQRLYESFSPLVLRAKELGRSLRIGTNHGSLSDRIMNRYGDTPLGMVESALEFIRIAESHNFNDIILSMKASNPKVMIQAYRLVVEKMKEENMFYPLHLGVTEAGDGEDARIKSAVGIGSLLADGLGDTIRVSLTEDPVYEIPVARDLADITHKLWSIPFEFDQEYSHDSIDPYEYTRRPITPIDLSDSVCLSDTSPPTVAIKPHTPLSDFASIAKDVIKIYSKNADTKIESLIFEINDSSDLSYLTNLQDQLLAAVPSYILVLSDEFQLVDLAEHNFNPDIKHILCKEFTSPAQLSAYLKFAELHNLLIAVNNPTPQILRTLNRFREDIIITAEKPRPGIHATGTYRQIAEELAVRNLHFPIWIRNTSQNFINLQNHFTSHILESSTFSGNLLCDGIGDMISIELEPDLQRATTLAYNILQGTRLRQTKTEFVACPSCGRTLFDLETTTHAIREKTGHLKGVTIAIMGCIVNGPGEMADADFGYVGGAPGKINLYVGKECVQYHIPQEEAVEKLIDLIKSHGKWIDPVLTEEPACC